MGSTSYDLDSEPHPLAEEHENTPGRGQLKRRAYDELKRLLVSGAIVPGTFLSERQLARQLGMSKTPVRAALERLEAEGFITVSPQQGIVVRELSLREIAEHYELRDALEPFVCRKLAGQLSEQQIEQIRENLFEQRRSVEQKDSIRNVQLDGQFHMMLCEFLGNREILRAMRQLRDKIHRVILQIAKRDLCRSVDSCQEHERIADAIIGGQAERAAAEMIAHLQAGKQSILPVSSP